jgi:hypothetical protein
MIAVLLEVYNGDSVQTPNSGDWVNCSLIMRHKDFSSIRGCLPLLAGAGNSLLPK